MTGIIKSNIPAAVVGGVEMLNELIKTVEALFYYHDWTHPNPCYFWHIFSTAYTATGVLRSYR